MSWSLLCTQITFTDLENKHDICGTNWLFCGTIWLGTIWPWNEMTVNLRNVSFFDWLQLKTSVSRGREEERAWQRGCLDLSPLCESAIVSMVTQTSSDTIFTCLTHQQRIGTICPDYHNDHKGFDFQWAWIWHFSPQDLCLRETL